MDARSWFAVATRGFSELVAGLPDDRWDDPGLGDWDVRALLGHATRALLTVEAYLGAAEPGAAPTLHTPAAYYAAAAAGLADPALVTRRGREAGAALGPEPVSAVLEIAGRVAALVDDSPDDAPVATPVGVLLLVDYLPTRAFELTVHGLDLARATGRPVPAELRSAATPAARLALDLASDEHRLDVLLALTGRERLPAGFSVV